MPNYTDYVTQAKNLVSTTLYGTTGVGEMSSNYSEEIDTLAPGDLRYQLRAWIIGVEDGINSNLEYYRFGTRLSIFYMVEDLASESGFTENDMLLYQVALLDRDAWRDLASVYDLESVPETGTAPEMSGGVVSLEIDLTALVLTG